MAEARSAKEKRMVEWNRIDMVLQNASIKKENIIEEGSSSNFSQYFLPHCPNGITNIHSYKKITVKNVYPGIDWVIYNAESKGFKYDFIVHPHADHGQIELIYSSLNPLKLNDKGEIELTTKLGKLIEHAPVCFQGEIGISAQYIKTHSLKNDKGGYDTHIKFSVDSYDRSNILVIDHSLHPH